jgi:hypothetical protein
LSVWMAGSSVQMRNAEVDPLGGSRTCCSSEGTGSDVNS